MVLTKYTIEANLDEKRVEFHIDNEEHGDFIWPMEPKVAIDLAIAMIRGARHIEGKKDFDPANLKRLMGW